jgi:YfiH family protein
LIADIKNRTVSAVHAGWRGLLKKIDLKAIEMFKSGYGSNLKDVYIFIGPSIRKCCFKVSGETYDLFFKQYKYNLPAEKEKNESGHTGYYFIDLAMIIKNNMASAGIPENNISDTGLCTCCNTDNLFFSYRKENITGRHAGIIMLE